VAAERDVFTSLGLIGEDPVAALGEATSAFAAGETDDASDDAAAVVALLDGADDAGRTRALAGGGVVVAAGGLAAAAVAMRRRQRAVVSPAESATSSTAGPVGGPLDQAQPYATLGGQPSVAPTDGPAAPSPGDVQLPSTPDATAPAEGAEGDRT
jgi:hypothetical protein